jgi:hypothetical protein
VGFIFRTIFWLGLAMVVLPPEARLGGGSDTAEFRDIDLADEFKNATDAVWSLGSQIANTCEANPQLCEAGAGMADAALATATNVATRVAEGMTDNAKNVLASAESAETTTKKIQARVE